ncbi:MAG: hypothetical protein GC156_15970 [Actinomycetales bacterium]|nr:hypothetical protein [Actinomycetales bacterium]
MSTDERFAGVPVPYAAGVVAVERKRVLGLLGIVLATAMAPGLVFTALGMPDGATLAAFGALTGLLGTMAAGARTALALVGALAVVSALAVPIAHSPWAAAIVLAAFSAAIALTSTRGVASALMLAPISLAFTLTEPPLADVADPGRALLIAAATALSGAFAVLVAHLLIPVRLPAGDRASRPRAVMYAATVGVVVGFASWVVFEQSLGHTGAWLIMTILIVMQPYLQDGWELAVQRAAGTVAGFVIAMAFVVVSGFPLIMYVAGGAFMFAALAVKFRKRPYWQFAALVTPSVVLLEGASGSLAETAWQRLLATLIGATVAVVVILLLRPLYRRSAATYGVDHW